MKATELLEEARRLQPKDQSSYVSSRLPQVLAESGITVWSRGDAIPSLGRRTLLGIAPYSLPDLQLLDALKEVVAQNPVSGQWVQVFDVLSCADMDDFDQYIPGIGHVYQTPVIGIWENGALIQKATGVKARRLIAKQYKIMT
jgi:hypothetical protein